MDRDRWAELYREIGEVEDGLIDIAAKMPGSALAKNLSEAIRALARARGQCQRKLISMSKRKRGR